MNADINPYDVLSCQIDDNLKVISKKYRDLARKYHPDKNNSNSNDNFNQIKKAYDEIINPVRREYWKERIKAKEFRKIREQTQTAEKRKYKVDLEKKEAEYKQSLDKKKPRYSDEDTKVVKIKTLNTNIIENYIRNNKKNKLDFDKVEANILYLLKKATKI